MKHSRMEGFVVDLAHRKSGRFLKHLVDVQDRAITGQDRDGLANGIGDGAKVLRFLAVLLLGALEVIYIGIDPTPTDEVRLPIVDRRCSDAEPAICPVEAAKTFFRRAGLLGLPDVLPPSSELLDIVRMDHRFPLPSNQLIQRKPRVIAKLLVDEIQGAIRKSRPGNRRNGVYEGAEFLGSQALALSSAHRVPASRQELGTPLPAIRIVPPAQIGSHAIVKIGR